MAKPKPDGTLRVYTTPLYAVGWPGYSVLMCQTDQPCHATLHYSMQKFIPEKRSICKRGFEKREVTKFLLPGSQIKDDWYPGDNTLHYFAFPEPVESGIYYCYVTFTVGGVDSPSSSAPFSVLV